VRCPASKGQAVIDEVRTVKMVLTFYIPRLELKPSFLLVTLRIEHLNGFLYSKIFRHLTHLVPQLYPKL